MFDRFYLPALLIGLTIQLIVRIADNTGLLTDSSRGILNGASLVFFALGLFFVGRLAGKMILNKVSRKR